MLLRRQINAIQIESISPVVADLIFALTIEELCFSCQLLSLFRNFVIKTTKRKMAHAIFIYL